MKKPQDQKHEGAGSSRLSRREFLARGSQAAGGAALAGISLPWVHAAEDNTVRLALIGCGGRGTGAAANGLSSATGPTELVAMADVVPGRLSGSKKALEESFAGKINVPADRQFCGFDGYRNAIDCLRPGDIAILATHAGFRAAHLEYAVAKGVNVFMEKSFAPDPGGIRKIVRLGEEADKKNLKIGTGLMCRHSTARRAMIERIREGAVGEVQLMRAYRMDSGDRLGRRNSQENELLWQIRNPYFFFWVSTGRFIDYLIHQVDECCWIKDAWPVSAHGFGGRAPHCPDSSQNWHSYSIEYTFADGGRALISGRFMQKCHDDFATFLHGTKCAAQFSGNVHAPTAHIYRDQRIGNENVVWRPERERLSPYQAEWDALLHAVRNDTPYNESRRSAYSNLAAIMGRAAVHCGSIVTWEQAMASEFQFCADAAALDYSSPAPVQADADGQYPVPVPGDWTEI